MITNLMISYKKLQVKSILRSFKFLTLILFSNYFFILKIRFFKYELRYRHMVSGLSEIVQGWGISGGSNFTHSR